MTTLALPSVGRGRRAAIVALATTAAFVVGLVASVGTTRAPALAVLAVAGGVAGVFALRAPALLVPCALAVLYANVPAIAVRMYGLPGLVGLAVPALLAVPLLHRLRRGEALIVPPVLVWMLVHLAVMLLAAGFADVRGAAVDRLFGFLTEGILLLFLLVNVVRTRRELRSALWTLVAVGALLGALSVLQVSTASYDQQYLGFAQVSENPLERFERDPTGEIAPPRVSGPIGEKNRYAQTLVVLVPIAAALAVGSRRRAVKLAAVVGTIGIGAGILLTYSRGAAAVLAVLLLLMFALKLLPTRAFVVAVLTVVLLGMLFPRWVDRFQGALAIFDSEAGVEAADGSTRGRLSATLGAVRVYTEHPVIGVGPGNYPRHHRSAAVEVGLRIVDNRQPHNMPVQMAAELGTVGLASFSAILAAAALTVVNARRRWADDPAMRAIATGLLLALVAYVGSSMFLHLAYERYLWALVALATAAGTVSGARVPGTSLMQAEEVRA